MGLLIRECTKDDLEKLREISIETFTDTFGRNNTPADLKAYLDRAFEAGRLRDELSDPDTAFYFLFSDGALAGYMKLNENKAQTDIHDAEALEVERIYMLNEFQGKGLGGVLMDKVIEIANIRGKSYIWLGVWENNLKALGFYRRMGFYKAGDHPFQFGSDIQNDYIMRRDLK